MRPEIIHPKFRTLAAAAAIAAIASGCQQEIIGPEHMKCTMFDTGETFTAWKKDFHIVDDLLFITDDTGKVRVWPLIPEDSNAYIARCEPLEEQRP